MNRKFVKGMSLNIGEDFKMFWWWDFPGVQGLRIHLAVQGTLVQFLVGELRCHILQSR